MSIELTTKTSRLAQRADRMAVAALWLVGSMIVFVLGAPYLAREEARLFPVVEGFEITKTRPTPAGVELSGLMRKRRDCRFESLSLYAGSIDDPEIPRERLTVTFLDQPEDVGPSRAEGAHFWGPWLVNTPRTNTGPDLFLYVTHQCHGLWDTRGVYLTVPLERIFPKT